MSQLSLFGGAADESSGPADYASRLAVAHAEAADLAARLPAAVRFGTSSWSFPGWRGIVYGRDLTQGALAREGLREYARHPLLRTVGVDRSFYAPLSVDDLTRYAGQLPTAFPCCFKAPASIASPTLPFERAARPARNPHFLSAERFAAELLEPVAQAFRDHAGPFIVEISPAARGLGPEPPAFCEGLDRMLSALPREFQYAVELREPALVTDEYARVLRAHGAGHVYNYWSAMPMPAGQAAQIPLAAMPFLVVRLLLRPGTRYDDRREAFRPFDRIVHPDAGMRAQVADLVADAVARAIPAYVLVNNKAEGSAPLTIRELARRVVERLA